jgi:very-short-patch-repair endonuclease
MRGDGVRDITKRATGATAKARRLRQTETDVEMRLWSDLRSRRLNGYKFARQIPFGPYVADFVCREQRLIVEVDGSQHSQASRDRTRDAFLCRHGYSVLRFWNDEVLREREAVLATILAALEGRLSPSPDLRFAPATLSPRGEGAEAPATERFFSPSGRSAERGEAMQGNAPTFTRKRT